MTTPTTDGAADERLQHLLAVEKRLQDVVRAAADEAARRVAAARAAGEARLAAARQEAEHADAGRALTERLEHEQAIAGIEAASRDLVLRIAALSEQQVDELARWVVDRAIAGDPA